jgi:hypothetical protein
MSKEEKDHPATQFTAPQSAICLGSYKIRYEASTMQQMKQSRKLPLSVYKLLKRSYTSSKSSNFYNTGKNALLKMKILYTREYSAQI